MTYRDIIQGTTGSYENEIKKLKEAFGGSFSNFWMARAEGADKIPDYYRTPKGALLCIQKNKRILHYGYIIKQSL